MNIANSFNHFMSHWSKKDVVILIFGFAYVDDIMIVLISEINKDVKDLSRIRA